MHPVIPVRVVWIVFGSDQFPFNVTAQPELLPILNNLIAAANAHVASVVPGVSQYEALDWSIMPCCDKTYNITVSAVWCAYSPPLHCMCLGICCDWPGGD
jgi:hypothetical protein